MCIGMANGEKIPECISGKIPTYNGNIHIPKIMRDMLNIQHADTLQLTATGNIIVIEKCEGVRKNETTNMLQRVGLPT